MPISSFMARTRGRRRIATSCIDFGGGLLLSGAMRNLALVAALVLVAAASCSKDQEPAGSGEPAAQAATTGGLLVEDVKVGTGDVATKGKTLSVHYTGRLTDGRKFDSSLDRKMPIEFPLGTGMVIKGWDQGLEGMK